jgi:hypothetical protein
MAALVVGAAAFLLHSLDRPWLKRRLQAVVRDAAGIELDYAATRVRLFAGLHVDGLVLRAPEPFAAATPELARVGSLEVDWSARALVGMAAGPRLRAVRLRDVTVAIARAADGRTSLSALGGGTPTSAAPPTPPTPPSRVLATLFAGAPLVGHAAIERAAATVVLLDERGAVRERLTLDGVSLEADAARAGGGWRAAARFASKEAPLALLLRRERSGAPAGEAALRLWGTVAAGESDAEARLELAVERQTLAPSLTIARALGLDARARADAGRKLLSITIGRAQLADDAALVDAELELGDAPDAPPRVLRAQGDIDLVRLLALLPDGLVPARARRAHAKATIEGLALALPPRLEPTGVARVDAELAGARASFGAVELSLPSGRVQASARPAADGVTAIDARLPLGDVTVGLDRGRRLSATALTVGIDGRVDRAGAATGDVTLRADGLDAAGLTGRDPLALRALRLSLALAGLHLGRDPASKALRARGRVSLSGDVGAVELGRLLRAEGATLGLSTRLTGALPPEGLEAELPIARLRVATRDGRPLVDERARVALTVGQAHLDADRPLRSRAVAHATVELGALRAVVDATKRPDAVDYDLTATSADLRPARLVAPSLTPAGWQIPWERIGLGARSKGTLAGLGGGGATLAITHTTELRLDRPSIGGAPLSPSARALAVTLTSRGTLRAHEGEADLRVTELASAGARRGDGHLALRFRLDPAAAAPAPLARVALTSEGEAGPTGTLTATLAFDRSRRALAVDVDGELGRLTLFAPLLAAKKGARGVDLSRLTAGVRTKLTVTGVVDDISPGGAVRLAPSPLATVGVDGTVALSATNVRWAEGDREITSPRLAWRAELRTDGARRTLHGALELDGLRAAFGERLLEVDGVRDTTDVAVTGDLRAGELSVAQTLALASLRQDLAPAYAVGDLSLELRARRGSDAVIRVDTLRIDNRAAGSALLLSGGLDLGDERRSLSLRGTITQDLSRLWAARQTFTGRGTVTAALRVDSANLTLFHALASLTAQSARVELPRERMIFDGLDGEIPLTADVVVDRKGLRLLRQGAPNAYAELRFADQHPLLTRRSYISARRVETPFFVAAPVAGNLRVEHNIVSLSQLEMGLRGGRVTGRCLIDRRDDDTTLQLHVRASQVRSSRGEPFDGNAAVVFSTRERSLDGRAEILRIGRRHLLDLLDLHDPHHGDASVNRVRKALAIGYPDHVRLTFRHGFASARVTLGGLGALVRIDELRGIPLGPIIDRALAPLDEKEEESP